MNLPVRITKTRTYKGFIVLTAILPDSKETRQIISRAKSEGDASGELWLDDGVTISSDQRRKIFAIISETADHTGYIDPSTTRQVLQLDFMQKHGMKEFFSLSDCSMTTARNFIDYLLEFAFYFGVPLKHFEIPKEPEDLVRHVYMCIKHKVCCICGKPADIHHYDVIGMGRDRKKYDDSQHRKLPLCRVHHSEAHAIGADTFCEKYIIIPIVYIEGIYGGNFDTDASVAEKLE